MDAANVRRDLRRALALVPEIDPGEWTPRELRHSFVSVLSDAGLPVEEIAQLVGHRGTTVTELVYRHQLRPVIQTGATVMDRLFALALNRLVGLGVERVVMEATSDYWRPPFYLFEAHGLDPWLVNAKDVRHLPGRPKTDRLDAVWLCKVAERQMLRPSFVPPADIRRLRDLTRYRIDLVGVRTAEKNRVEKLLEDACLKLSVVASDIFGLSGRAMLAALVAGERDPKALAELARTRMRTKIPGLEEAFAGLRLGTFDDDGGVRSSV
jgi:transposase